MHSSTRRRASTAATRSSAAACRSRSGSRWPTRCRGATRVTACFFGEGAVGRGRVPRDRLNLAALWKLPVLFVCENNLYAMGTALERSESETDIRAQGRRLSHRRPKRSTAWMWSRSRRRRGAPSTRSAPAAGRTSSSASTYRFRAHSMFDAAALSRQGRSRGLEEARSDHALRRLAASSRPAARRTTSTRIETEVAARGRRRRRLRRSRHLGAGRGSDARRLHAGRGAGMSDGRAARSPIARRCARRIREALHARSARLPDGRGRRPLRRLLRRDQGPARGVRRGAHPRHAAVGIGLRRRRHRRGARRHAADRRDHDGQFQPAGARPDRQQRRHASGTCRAGSSTCRW